MIAYFWGSEPEEIEADEKQKYLRHKMIQQIKKSNNIKHRLKGTTLKKVISKEKQKERIKLRKKIADRKKNVCVTHSDAVENNAVNLL